MSGNRQFGERCARVVVVVTIRRYVDWNGELVDQLESHWQHRLRPRLDGLTDDEYFWQPVADCWTISRRGATSAPKSLGAGDFTWDFGEPQDPEPVTTIAWRLAHLIVGFAEMNGTHFGGPPTHVATFDYAGTAKEALRQLDGAHDMWVEGVRGLGDAGACPAARARRFRPSSPMHLWRGSSCTRAWRYFTTVQKSACFVTSICAAVSKQRDEASRPSPGSPGG